jgi:hypothetical protein
MSVRKIRAANLGEPLRDIELKSNEEGMTVAQLIERGDLKERPKGSYIINGIEAKLDSIVREGDIVISLPPIMSD